MSVELVEGDITPSRPTSDVIVNAANPSLLR